MVDMSLCQLIRRCLGLRGLDEARHEALESIEVWTDERSRTQRIRDEAKKEQERLHGR